MKTTAIEIRRPDDGHVHLRGSETLLRRVAMFTARVFKRGIVMPNLGDEDGGPVVTVERADAYRGDILGVTEGTGFEPLMAWKLTPETTPEDVERFAAAGHRWAKLYPDWRPDDPVAGETTTNAGGGIYDFEGDRLMSVFAAMEACGVALLVHAETPGLFVMDREKFFVKDFVVPWAKKFPKLKIVIEHATDRNSASVALELENVACSITAHHLVTTLDDVVGGRLDPHCFCKPVAKTPLDRLALVEVATSGTPSVYFGSDTAPHTLEGKRAGAAGDFTAPAALEIVTGVFETQGRLDNLEAFVSENFARFHDLPLNEEKIQLVREPKRIPLAVDIIGKEIHSPPGLDPRDLIPFWAGRELPWSVRK